MWASGFIALEEQKGRKKKGKAKPINCELIVHSSFPLSRTRPRASLCGYMQACVHICKHTHLLQLELQIAGYTVQSTSESLNWINQHTSQWLPFSLTVAHSLTPITTTASQSSQPRASSSASTPTLPPTTETQSHGGGVNTCYYLSWHLGKHWKVQLPCYFTLPCYHPLPNFLLLFALQLLVPGGSSRKETGHTGQRAAISLRNNSNQPKCTDCMDASAQMRQERFPVVSFPNCTLPVSVPVINHVRLSRLGSAPLPSPAH